MHLTVVDEYAEVAQRLRQAADAAMARAEHIRLLFVTNLRSGPPIDFGPSGVSNTAQHYTRREAEAMIRLLQDLGFTVETFFSEMEFLTAFVEEENSTDPRLKIVYTTAEGGSGSGRRALIPALCNLGSIPVLNSGAHASSLARHKLHAHAVLRHVGVRVPGTWQYWNGQWTAGLEPPAGSKVIVKPTYESMGIGVNDTSIQLVDTDFGAFLLERCERFGQPAIVQEFVSGEEVGVPVARINKTYALPPIAQRHANGDPFESQPKTFAAENLLGDLSHVVLDGKPTQLEALRRAAVSAFDALGMEGVGRVDFKIDADGRAWAFDTNESPPPSSPTCWAVAMEQLGFSLPEMVAAWVGICLGEHTAQESDQKESSTQGISRP